MESRAIIKGTTKVKSLIDASNFIQRVQNLLFAYPRQAIVVYIYTENNSAVLENLTIEDHFTFDILRSVFARNTNNVIFDCIVEVMNKC